MSDEHAPYDSLLVGLRAMTQKTNQRVVAERLGVPQPTISRWISRATERMPLERALSVADLLGWSRTRKRQLEDDYIHVAATRRAPALAEHVDRLDARLDAVEAQLEELIAELRRGRGEGRAGEA